MPRAIPLKVQHSLKELKSHYRACTDAVERRRIHVIWLLSEGRKRNEVSDLTAYNRISICQIIKRYNEQGLCGLADRRHENQGCPPLLDEAQREQLLAAMQHDAQAVWNARKVQQWVKENTGKDVYVQRAYELLECLNFSLQSSRPQHVKADAAAQEAFKKTL